MKCGTTVAQMSGRVKRRGAQPLAVAAGEEGTVAAARGAHGAVTGQLAEAEDDGIADGVIDEISGTLAADQSGLTEGLEVFRGIGLAGAEGGGDFADGTAAAFEEVENAEAGGVGEKTEPFRSELNLQARKLGRFHL